MIIITLNPGSGMSKKELHQAFSEKLISDRQNLDVNLETLNYLFEQSLEIHLSNGKIVEKEHEFYINPRNGIYCIGGK